MPPLTPRSGGVAKAASPPGLYGLHATASDPRMLQVTPLSPAMQTPQTTHASREPCAVTPACPVAAPNAGAPTLAVSIAQIEACYASVQRETEQGSSAQKAFARLGPEAYKHYLHRSLRMPEVKRNPAAALDPHQGKAELVFTFLMDLLCHTKRHAKTAMDDLKVIAKVSSWMELLARSKRLQERVEAMPEKCQLAFAQGLGKNIFQEMSMDHQAPETIPLLRERDLSEGTGSDTDSDYSVEEVLDDEWTRMADAVMQRQFEELNGRLRECGSRIVIMGPTGVGKSSLVNACFKYNFSEVGIVHSTTRNINHVSPTTQCPIHIYDTQGFDPIEANIEAKEQLVELLKERKEAEAKYDRQDPNSISEKIHAVWWVVDTSRANIRLRHVVNEIFMGEDVPIFIVINKCDAPGEQVDDVQRELQATCPWAKGVLTVVARTVHGPIRHVCEACGSQDIMISTKGGYYSCQGRCRNPRISVKTSYGIVELIEATAAVLPQVVLNSFLCAQKEWLKGLDVTATKIILMHTGVSSGIGAVPVPVIGVCGVVANDASMILNLARHYNIQMSHAALLSVLGSAGGLGGARLVAIGCSNLLKAIPGVGAVGIVADFMVSGASTLALGYLTKTLLRRVRGIAVAGEVTREHLLSIMTFEEQQKHFIQYFRQAMVVVKGLGHNPRRTVDGAWIEQVMSTPP